MRRPFVLALALLTGALTVQAGAAPRPLSRAAALARWQQNRERLAQTLPLDRALRHAATASGDEAVVFPVGDLDRDGLPDVVDARYHWADGTGGLPTESMRLEAHRGRDGRQLWQIDLGAASYAFPLVAKVGANGVPGIVVVSYTIEGTGAIAAGGGQYSTTVSAYDNAGKQAWTRTFPGGAGESIVSFASASTFVEGLLDAVPGGGTDVLVETAATDDTFPLVGEAAASVAQLAVIDGSTGLLRPLGAPIPSTSYVVDAEGIGDVDGDHVDDAAATVTSGPKTNLLALSGATGKPIWVATGMPDSLGSYVTATQDVTGDRVPDVMVEHSPWGLLPTTGFEGGVSVVDAKSGTVAWTRPGFYGYAVGDVDRKAGSEVAVASFLDGEEDEIGVGAIAYDAKGTARWESRQTVATDPDDGFFASMGFFPAGDVQGDGAPDLGFSLQVNPEHGKGVTRSGVIDGRTGHAIRTASGVDPAFAPLDGHGDDLYAAKAKNGVLSVTAWQGDRPNKLWSRTMRVPGRVSPFATFALPADRDACYDLGLHTYGDGVSVDVLLSGADGRPLWTLTRHGDAAAVVTPGRAGHRACGVAVYAVAVAAAAA